MGEEGLDRDRSLYGERSGAVVLARGEGVGAVVEHLLGECAGRSLDAKITEHGIRLPTAKELDVVGVDSGAEEGGSTAWTEGASTEELGRDAGDGLEEAGRVT